MFGIGPMELMLILVVALLVLGPKRMPELARTMGKGLAEFRRASNDLRQSLAIDEIQNELRDGITGAGTIKDPVKKPVKRPEAEDRPAQAGDDLAVATAPDEGAESPDAAVSAQADTPPHPGELPLDADPHEHHDEAEAPSAPASADSELGAIPVSRTAASRASERAESSGAEKTSADETSEAPDASERDETSEAPGASERDEADDRRG